MLTSEDVVYLSGPMTGISEWNHRAFHAADQALSSLGVRVLNPAKQPPGLSWTEYMRADLELLREATAVLMLAGWQDSRGARIEMNMAEVAGLKIVGI